MRAGAEREVHTAAGPQTVEAWARRLLAAGSPAAALSVGGPPAATGADVRDEDPGRPARIGPDLGPRTKRSFRRSSLAHPRGRAELLARFAHHELQAAELMAWACLRFGRSPRPFRLGLARIAGEELEHAALLRARVVELGFDPEEFVQRDWFWERVPTVTTPGAFCAVMGLGLEAANLEHAELWAARLESAGDPQSAALQRRIGAEEVAHVRFGRVWFERFEGPLAFEAWRQRLPAPLTPSVFRGRRLAREARKDAGLTDEFIDLLDEWPMAGA